MECSLRSITKLLEQSPVPLSMVLCPEYDNSTKEFRPTGYDHEGVEAEAEEFEYLAKRLLFWDPCDDAHRDTDLPRPVATSHHDENQLILPFM